MKEPKELVDPGLGQNLGRDNGLGCQKSCGVLKGSEKPKMLSIKSLTARIQKRVSNLSELMFKVYLISVFQHGSSNPVRDSLRTIVFLY